MASLESLLPQDLERHCQMNAARLTSYLLLCEEIVRYCETRGVIHDKPGKGRKQEDDDAMDVSPFGKAGKGKGAGKGKDKKGGKGSGKGKEEKTDAERKAICHTCSRTGHYACNCWWKPADGAEKPHDKKGKGGGKSAKKGTRREQPRWSRYQSPTRSKACSSSQLLGKPPATIPPKGHGSRSQLTLAQGRLPGQRMRPTARP